MSKCVTMESKELIDPCFLFHILHYLPGLQIPDGVSLKSMNGEGLRRKVRKFWPMSICAYTICLYPLLLLSPQEARDFEIIFKRGSVLPSSPSYAPFRRFVLLNYPAAQSAPKSGACETAMTQERISFQLAVCCDKMARITSICVAMIMIPQE